MENGAQDADALFTALSNETTFPADETPDGGPEPAYSGLFIRHPVYGTRCSTVVAVDRLGTGTITERQFDAEGQPAGETSLTFAWTKAAQG
jgi:uncharacterized protein with NRDE domain